MKQFNNRHEFEYYFNSSDDDIINQIKKEIPNPLSYTQEESEKVMDEAYDKYKSLLREEKLKQLLK